MKESRFRGWASLALTLVSVAFGVLSWIPKGPDVRAHCIETDFREPPGEAVSYKKTFGFRGQSSSTRLTFKLDRYSRVFVENRGDALASRIVLDTERAGVANIWLQDTLLTADFTGDLDLPDLHPGDGYEVEIWSGSHYPDDVPWEIKHEDGRRIVEVANLAWGPSYDMFVFFHKNRVALIITAIMLVAVAIAPRRTIIRILAGQARRWRKSFRDEVASWSIDEPGK